MTEETPEAFTERILSLCEFIWTIRPVEQPDLIIGDCALHHWNKTTGTIEIGGSLLVAYQGKGIMQSAFQLLIKMAKEKLKVRVYTWFYKSR